MVEKHIGVGSKDSDAILRLRDKMIQPFGIKILRKRLSIQSLLRWDHINLDAAIRCYFFFVCKI